MAGRAVTGETWAFNQASVTRLVGVNQYFYLGVIVVNHAVFMGRVNRC